MQNIFDAIKGTGRKAVIMGKYLQTVVDMAIKEGYLTVDKEVIGDLSNLKDKDSIVLVNNDREAPYYNLSRIVNGYDKYVTLLSTDTVCFADPSYDAVELTAVKLKNDIAIKGADIYDVPKGKSVRLHASSEDLMMMINLMNPKYYFPVKGEYSEQVANGDLALNLGIPSENIILKENGSVATFENGKLIDSYKEIPTGVVYIDGESSDDIGELVLKDREVLSKDGILIASATIDKKTKKILAGPEILTRGFIYVKDSQELIDSIKGKCLAIINENTHNNYVDYSKIKNGIRDTLSKYLFEETGNRPMIITVIQEI